MVVRLDTLGNDFDAQRFADLNDGRDQLTLRDRLGDGRDQLTVDLEPARLQLEQGHYRSMAGAEVIDLDVDAEFLYVLQVPRDQVVIIIEEDGLDQLKRKGSFLDGKLAQAMDQILVLQALGGDIDRDVRDVETAARPVLEVL